MSFKLLGVLLAAALAVSTLARAEDMSPERREAIAALIPQIMKVTLIKTIDGQNLQLDKFVEDKDPNVIQVVYYSGDDMPPNHVSNDGKVIFWNQRPGDADAFQALLMRAFAIRAAKQLDSKNE